MIMAEETLTVTQPLQRTDRYHFIESTKQLKDDYLRSNRQAWIDVLRSGAYTEHIGSLHETTPLENHVFSYIGVACDLAFEVTDGAIGEWVEQYGRGVISCECLACLHREPEVVTPQGFTFNTATGEWQRDVPPEVAEFFGINQHAVEGIYESHDHALREMNIPVKRDMVIYHNSYTFEAIADTLEEYFMEHGWL